MKREIDLIGIHGKKGSGKDTVTKIIQALTSDIAWDKANVLQSISDDATNHNNLGKWQNKKFADKLKQMVALLIGCSMENLEDRRFKNTSVDGWTLWDVVVPNPHESEGYHRIKSFATTSEAGKYIELAKPLYENGALKWNPRYMKIQPRDLTPRWMLQVFGTEGGRELIHPNIWVLSLFADWKYKHEKYVKLGNGKMCKTNAHRGGRKDLDNLARNWWIISDVRFPNEADEIKKRCGLLIKVNRNLKCDGCGEYSAVPKMGGKVCRGKCEDEFMPYTESEKHVSEPALNGYKQWDYVIDNNGTLEELIEKVREILITEKIIPNEK